MLASSRGKFAIKILFITNDYNERDKNEETDWKGFTTYIN